MPAVDRRILRPGWAGALDEAEFGFVVATLRRDERRRLQWGVRFDRPGWEQQVRFLAMYGCEDNPAANRRMARTQRSPMRAVGPAKQMPMRMGVRR